MNKTLLTGLVFLGSIVIYFLGLIIATIIATYIFVEGDPDDYDYAMATNVVQFLVMMLIIGEKVGQWIN